MVPVLYLHDWMVTNDVQYDRAMKGRLPWHSAIKNTSCESGAGNIFEYQRTFSILKRAEIFSIFLTPHLGQKAEGKISCVGERRSCHSIFVHD